MAGVDEALLKPRSITKEIGALLPLPIARRLGLGGRRRGGSDGRLSEVSRHLGAVDSIQNAATMGEPAGSALTFGPAAAIAALAIVGGGGVLSGSTDHHGPAAERHSLEEIAGTGHKERIVAKRRAAGSGVAPAAGGGPHEWLGILVVGGEVGLDRRDQVGHRVKDPAADGLVGQLAKPPLDQVQPRA
jgi:hypothetical protein